MSPRFFALPLALLAGLLLAGCHTVRKLVPAALVPTSLVPPNLRPPAENPVDALKRARQQLRQATPCCSSFADFSYRSLLPWQPQKFTLGNTSMVANIGGTKSYFLAFRLPTEVELPYQVALKAQLNGRWLHASYLFAPTVVVLDGGFQPLRSDDITLCEHMGWSDDTTGAFGSFKVDNKQARYLLVYSSARQQSGKTYWEQSPTSFSNSTAATLKMNSTGSFSIPHGPDGSLWIGMMNSTYKKAIDSAICDKAHTGAGLLGDLPLPWNGTRGGKAGKSP
ncbi:MAG: hypothetical protein EPN69_06025 [Rhodanobacter sp.]|nr:MAG: hypothetical protein EPN71_16985 [Rhodanobacter sp.]TAL94870.1 MAG: hypothetical protein EPN69_06025 [Rhodanobacter sp.]TAM40169.1 MAG: hypothetical protein EPN58_11875 [Rhodanobacter sp.]